MNFKLKENFDSPHVMVKIFKIDRIRAEQDMYILYNLVKLGYETKSDLDNIKEEDYVSIQSSNEYLDIKERLYTEYVNIYEEIFPKMFDLSDKEEEDIRQGRISLVDVINGFDLFYKSISEKEYKDSDKTEEEKKK